MNSKEIENNVKLIFENYSNFKEEETHKLLSSIDTISKEDRILKPALKWLIAL